MSMNNISNQSAPNYGSAIQKAKTAVPLSEGAAGDRAAITPAQADYGDTVDLGLAQKTLILADDNHDGVTDRQELANAAYQILGNPDATSQDLALGSLFASFVLGGKDGQGLNPDINQDGGVTGNELALIAKGDNQSTGISKNDIAQAFGSRVKTGGNSFTLSDLQTIAQSTQTDAASSATEGAKTADATNSKPGITPDALQSILESTTSIVNSLNKMLQSQQSSGTTPATTPAQTAPAAEAAPVANEQAPTATTTNSSPAESAPLKATQASGGTAAIILLLSLLLKVINLHISQQGSQQTAAQ